MEPRAIPGSHFVHSSSGENACGVDVPGLNHDLHHHVQTGGVLGFDISPTIIGFLNGTNTVILDVLLDTKISPTRRGELQAEIEKTALTHNLVSGVRLKVATAWSRNQLIMRRLGVLND
ncbi:hypothetical protein KA050_02965 [Candidatus Gracilibacteria bacterium]|nr:hypothetical protein [Candidatus Gracilibacteria bacterium]